MRRNRSETAKRRSHHALKVIGTVKCECGSYRLPHTVCASCGKYNGRIVIDIVARAKRQARRDTRRQKELRESGQITEDKTKEATQA